MTEQEAIEELKCYRACGGTKYPEEIEVAMSALEEIQRYRAIGTVDELRELKESAFSGLQLANIWAALEKLKKYEAIGTVEECRKAVEKQTTKKPIRIDMCTCPNCGTYNEIIKKRRNTVDEDIVFCWHCGQALEVKRGEEE